MAYERAVKRMDEAVASSWLRGLRSERRPRARAASAQQRVIAASHATRLGNLDGPVATAKR